MNIFTSNVSNLLLPLGAKGSRDFESYPTSKIGNKYIYDAFLMIYLSVLLFLFFVTFWHFKRVNRRFIKAVILRFCKIVIKSQDDISKRAEVEKEPLTLEKDKED